ncbi:class I SAM-dependent methyltransferase [Paracoccaceae bacterium]|nr:class I SAM-dependent methyltransferase [Paracoccaceae bacterium]
MKFDDNLICPGCRSGLYKYHNSFLCSNKNCDHSLINDCFSCIGETPVLISEILCDTVCSVTNINSLVKRSGDGGKLKNLKKHVVGESKTTKLNIFKFIQFLEAINEKPVVLIIGSGEIGSGTDKLYSSKLQIVGTDVYCSSSVDYVADAHYLPFKDAIFDGVIVQAVLEHVVDPQLVVSEIHRVLKKDGIVYAETPFMQQVHEGAYDFTRFTVLGHRYLFKHFERIDSGGIRGVGVVLAWSIRAFIQGMIRNSLISKIVFTAVNYFLAIIEKFADPKSLHDANSGSYFLGKRSESSITHKELVKEYRGCGGK